jgi:hypothetical protein
MLRMIQRVFYCDLGSKPQAIAGWDLDTREHLALWPVVALFLAMGLASPLWMRAIDTFGAPTAAALQADRAINIVSEAPSHPENPCPHILAEMREHIPDVNYDKRHHTGICNDDGSLMHPDLYYEAPSPISGGARR